MTTGTLILVERQRAQSDRTVEIHAERLREREVADSVVVERYDDGLGGTDLTGDYDERDTEEVYVVPMLSAQTKGTQQSIPPMVASITDSPTFCDPVGKNPIVTDVIADRASELIEPAADVSLILVGLGSSSSPHQQRMLQYHRTRLLERTAYGEVTTAYLLQDPAVECAAYNVSNDWIVAVPVFVSPSAATREEIPRKIGVDRSGIEYADPFGTHPRLTDAIQAEVATQRVIRNRRPESGSSISEGLTSGSHRPVATDGRGSSE